MNHRFIGLAALPFILSVASWAADYRVAGCTLLTDNGGRLSWSPADNNLIAFDCANFPDLSKSCKDDQGNFGVSSKRGRSRYFSAIVP